jgi:ribosomal protein S18 acetylase RimI-like enzyme
MPEKGGAVRVRPVRRGDREALARLYRDAFSAPPFREPWSLGDARRRILQLTSSPFVAGWAAVPPAHARSRAPGPVGFAFLEEKQGHGRPYGELLEWAVSPAFRKKGAGSALLGAVLARARRRRFRVVAAVLFRGPLEKWIRRRGFRPSRRSRVYAWK